MRISDWSSDVCSSDLLAAGMIFTVEPMINAGRRDIREMGDGWTIKTKDRRLSAQWEHTVLVTETGHEIQIGRASWRERVCQYVWISVVGVSLIKKTHRNEVLCVRSVT